MAPLYYVLLAIIVVCAILLGILVHAGFFYELQIRMTSPTSLPRRVAYSVHKGPYKNAGTPFGKLAQLVPKLKLFGVYYDDPKSVGGGQHQINACSNKSSLAFPLLEGKDKGLYLEHLLSALGWSPKGRRGKEKLFLPCKAAGGI